MLVVDTNVLIDAANTKSPYHSACRRWLERQQSQSGAWYLTWPIVYEFLRVVTHPRVMAPPLPGRTAWTFVTVLLESPGLGVLSPTQRHADVAGGLIDEFPELAGSIFHDAHTAVLMREHGIKQICTRDTDFHRFRFIDVIDPVRG